MAKFVSFFFFPLLHALPFVRRARPRCRLLWAPCVCCVFFSVSKAHRAIVFFLSTNETQKKGMRIARCRGRRLVEWLFPLWAAARGMRPHDMHLIMRRRSRRRCKSRVRIPSRNGRKCLCGAQKYRDHPFCSIASSTGGCTHRPGHCALQERAWIKKYRRNKSTIEWDGDDKQVSMPNIVCVSFCFFGAQCETDTLFVQWGKGAKAQGAIAPTKESASRL
nr:hypothetical protein [Pandoravirus massiliensis]